MCSYFIRTLEGPFFKNMLGTHVKEFVDLVEIGERIEANIQEGKVELMPAESGESQSRKGQPPRKKEGAVSFIQSSYSHRPSQTTFRPRYNPTYQYQQPSPVNQYTASTPQSSQPYQINHVPYTRPYAHPSLVHAKSPRPITNQSVPRFTHHKD